MQNEHPRIRIELTDEQRKEIKEAAGHDISALEFSVDELEQRIAPVNLTYGNVHWVYQPQKPG